MARAFLDANRHHMAMEEKHFFPLALQVLTAEDWAEIDTRITNREDPLFGIKVETQFQTLHEAILVFERSGQASPRV